MLCRPDLLGTPPIGGRLRSLIGLTPPSPQTLNEVSSDDHVWRRFCNERWRSDDEGCEGKRWKVRYMAWLQPRLKQYATSKGRYFNPR